MNTLPQTGTSNTTTFKNSPIPQSGGSFGKEVENLPSLDIKLKDVGEVGELPKEVVSVGVKNTPTVVPIPPPIQQMGVRPAGQNVAASSGATVILPLSQQQIADGLKQQPVSSWRWLAVWCIKQLKQLRFLQMKKG